jgi:hypothetical protein
VVVQELVIAVTKNRGLTALAVLDITALSRLS